MTALTCGLLGKTAVAVSCSQGGTFRIWDLETRKPYGEPVLHNSSTKHEKRVTGAAIGELSARPVIVSAGLNGEARIWDPATGVQVGEPLRGHQSGDPSLGDFRYVTAVDFGYVKGQPRIITGGNDATVRVWDPHTSQQLGRSLAGHKDGITSVRIAIVQGRATVVSASEDSTVRLWDAETGEELAMFVSDSPVRTCAISPNGEMVVAGCRSGVIHFFSIEN